MLMADKRKRLLVAVSVALGVHIMIALVLGILGIRSMRYLPPQIIEISLSGGGGGGGGSGEVKNKAPAKEERKSAPAAKDEITDTTKKEITPTNESKPETSRDETSDESADTGDSTGDTTGSGTGSGTGEGSGTGSGSGSGEGDGTGSGSGSGEGDGTGPGSGVPVTAPRVLRSVEPIYPPNAKRSGVEGVTYVHVMIDTSGNVTEATVAQSSGRADMDNAAVEAAWQWQFSPALDTYGVPAVCGITFPMRFHLVD